MLRYLIPLFEGSNGHVPGVSGAGAINPPTQTFALGVDSASATYATHTTIGALKL